MEPDEPSEDHVVRPLRVVQWATGNVGLRSLRAVIDHPGLELVGVWVHSADKVGRDAGELCGTEPIGVTATNALADVVDLAPDCVLYMPSVADLDEVCALLRAGANIVTTRHEFLRPLALDPADRRRVEDACREGGTSIHATGSSPGFITATLPLALLTLVRRLDLYRIDEFADMSSRNSPQMIFELMGFGRDPAHFSPRAFRHTALAFAPALELLADELGLRIDSVEAGGDVAVAAESVDVAAGRVEAGTVAAQRPTVTALRDGEPLLQFRAHWYLTDRLDPAWELQDSGWRVEARGDTPLDVRIRFPVEPERYPLVSPGFTAHPAVNAVAAVCAAPPGIRTAVDLPVVAPALGGRPVAPG